MNKKIFELLLFNHGAKKIFACIFFSSLFQANPIYKKILSKRIKKIADLYQYKPYCIRIENTNICNAHCVMCPREQMKRKMGFMPKDIYKKIIDEAVKLKINYINLHNFGEPLLDPHFCEKVIYAKEKGIKTVSTNSNGSVLTKELSQNLIESGLDKLFISIDAATRENYEKVRIGLKYDSMAENIENFIKLRREFTPSNPKGNLTGLKQKKPELIVNFVAIGENKKEIKPFIKKWKKIADHVSISFSHDWTGEKKNLKIKNCKYPNPCRLLWTELTIAWNGDYLLCCQDYDGRIVLGNIRETSIEKMWQSDKLKFYKDNQLKKGRGNLPLCQNCQLNTFWWF